MFPVFDTECRGTNVLALLVSLGLDCFCVEFYLIEYCGI